MHSDFTSPASGEFNRQLQADFTAKIEQLLSEKATGNIASAAAGSGGEGQQGLRL